jgi:hypothetical protein
MSSAERKHVRAGTPITMAPRPDPGGALVVSDRKVRFVDRGYGNYSQHRCPARTSACKYCGERVRVLNSPPGQRERLVVVDAQPNPHGWITIDADGYAIYDSTLAMPGEHFLWHTKH